MISQPDVVDQCDALSTADGALPTDSPAPTLNTGIVAVALAALVYIAFAPAKENGFVSWDDGDNFVLNEDFRGLGFSQILWAWSTFKLAVYQPLAWMLFEAQYLVFRLNPTGYHRVSLVLHAIDSVVLYALVVALLRRCCPDRYRREPQGAHLAAGLAVALFSVHPLRSEAVAWASCQPYLPCALFAMLAVLAYVRAHDTSPARAARVFVAWLLFGVALLFKAVAISLPAVLLILDVYPLRRLSPRPRTWFNRASRAVWAEKIPFLTLSIIFAMIAIRARNAEARLVELGSVNLRDRLVEACFAVWFYLAKAVAPINLLPLYVLPRSAGVRCLWYSLAVIGTVGLTAWSIARHRRRPGLLAAWCAYLAILAPNLGLLRTTPDQIVADRYSYLSHMPLVVLLAYGLWRPSGRRRPAAGVVGLAMAAVVILAALTRAQCRIWETPFSLWTYTVEHGPPNPVAYEHLALVYFHGRGDVARAEGYLAESLRTNPKAASTHIIWAGMDLARNRYDAAEAHYKAVLRIVPRDVNAMASLGWLAVRRAHFEEAGRWFAVALRVRPGSADTLYGLGLVAAGKGDLTEARRLFSQALRLDAKHAGALRALADPEGELKEVSGAKGPPSENDPDKAASTDSGGVAAASTAASSNRRCSRRCGMGGSMRRWACRGRIAAR